MEVKLDGILPATQIVEKISTTPSHISSQLITSSLLKPAPTERKAAARNLRLKMLPSMIQKLDLSSGWEKLSIEELIFFILIKFFHLIMSKTEMDSEGFQEFVNFLNFIKKQPLSDKNCARFNDILIFIKKHVQDSTVLEDEQILDMKSGIIFLLAAIEFQGETVEQLLKEDKTIEEGNKDTSLVQDLFSKVFEFNQFLLDIVDKNFGEVRAQLIGLQRENLFSIKNRKLMSQLPDALASRIVEYEKGVKLVDRLLSSYEARKSLFHKELTELKKMLDFSKHVPVSSIFCRFSQIEKSSVVIKRQLLHLKKQIERLGYLESYLLSESEVDKIQKEERPSSFKKYYKNEKLPEPKAKAIPVTATNNENEAIKEKNETVEEVSMATMLQKILKFSEEMAQLQSNSEKLRISVAKALEDNKKFQAEKEETRKQIFLKLPANQKKNLEYILSEQCRNFAKFSHLLDNLKSSFSLFGSVIKAISRQVELIEPKMAESSHASLDLLLERDEQIVKSKKKREKILPDESSLESESPSPTSENFPSLEEDEEIHSVETTEENEIPTKISIREIFSDLSRHLTHEAFFKSFQPLDINEERLETTLSYIKDLNYHTSLLESLIHLLKKCSIESHSSLLVFFVSRYASLVSEHGLTCRLLLKRENVLLKHDHFGLISQLGWNLDGSKKNQWLRQYLDKVCYGTVAHRYNHMIHLRNQMKGFSNPECLDLMLNPRDSENQIVNMIVDTVSFLELYCIKGQTRRAVNLKNKMIAAKESKTKKSSEKRKLLSKKLKIFFQPLMKNLVELHDFSLRIIDCQEDPLAKALWKDTAQNIERLNQTLALVIRFPSIKYLALYTDAILTLLQYLDELIERGLHLQKNKELLTTHDLMEYRQLRCHLPDKEETACIEALNVQTNAQCPHRNLTRFNRENGLTMRFHAYEITKAAEKHEKQLLEFLHLEEKGYQKQSRRRRQNTREQPVLKIYEHLSQLIEKEITISKERLDLLIT
jgi:hypothetical protein